MKTFITFIAEEREPSGRMGKNIEDYKLKMNSRVGKMIKKASPVYDQRDNDPHKKANDHLISVGKRHGVNIDKLHNDITGYYAMIKPGQDKDKISKALTEYEKTVGKQVK